MITRLLAIGATMFVLTAAAPGTVKVDEDGSLPNNEPHVCAFDVRDWKSDSTTYTIQSWPPTGDGTVVASGTTATLETISLPVGHYRLTAGNKHKMFWVECAPPSVAPTQPPVVVPPAPVVTLDPAALPETDTDVPYRTPLVMFLTFATLLAMALWVARR